MGNYVYINFYHSQAPAWESILTHIRSSPYAFPTRTLGTRERDDSDIDILVDFHVTPDLLTFIELEEFLSENLKKRVDLVPARKLKSSLKEQILKEAVVL